MNEKPTQTMPDGLEPLIAEFGPASIHEENDRTVAGWKTRLGGNTAILARSNPSGGWKSCVRQVSVVRQTLADRGLEPACIVASLGSGVGPWAERIDLRLVLDQIDESGLDVIAITDHARLSRDPMVGWQVLAELSQRRVELIVASGILRAGDRGAVRRDGGSVAVLTSERYSAVVKELRRRRR